VAVSSSVLVKVYFKRGDFIDLREYERRLFQIKEIFRAGRVCGFGLSRFGFVDFPCKHDVWPFQIRVFLTKPDLNPFSIKKTQPDTLLHKQGGAGRVSSFSLYLLCLKPVSLPPPLPNLYLHRSSTLYPLPPPPPPPLPTTHTLKYNVEIKNYGKGIDDSGGSFAPAWWSTRRPEPIKI
jgi:hypothetical protein